MRSLNEALEIEEADEHEFLDVGPRKLTPFEAARLAENPCRPIWRDRLIEDMAEIAEANWYFNLKARSKAIPATIDRQFVRSEGQP